MTNQVIPVRPTVAPECRTCGTVAPVDEHFCPQCTRILALGRHGDYFSFLGLPRRLTFDPRDLERRFRDLSRQFHPDYYYNAPPAERLASLERASYLNDAYRTLRQLDTRAEYLLAIEGQPISKQGGDGSPKAPAAMLAEVFALNEELDEIREARESGASSDALTIRLAEAGAPIERRRAAHEQSLRALAERWDALPESSPDRAGVLAALREEILARNYISNLLATIEREAAALAGGVPGTEARPHG